MVALAALVAAAAAAVACAAEEGASDARALLRGRLGSKSAYAERLRSDEQLEVGSCLDADCKPVHLFMVVRHGTRFPTAKRMRKMASAGRIIGGEDWEPTFREEDAGFLARIGEDELFEMGRRTRERFPALFQEAYHPLRFDFVSSQVPRALQSAAAFAHGLFHDDADPRPYEHVSIRSETKELDTVLRFHKACPAYQQGVKKNETLKETGPAARLATAVYDHLHAAIQERLRAKGQTAAAERVAKAAAADLVAGAWDACVMELSVLNRTSASCALFEPRDAELLDLVEDVSNYWIKGHGHAINFEMACPLVRDMLESTKQAAAEAATPGGVDRLATLRFAHAETLFPLLARLGLFEDSGGAAVYEVPEGADLFAAAGRERKWRSGALVPFAANLGLVLFECGQDGPPLVQLLHNEAPLRLPPALCPPSALVGESLCPLGAFEAALGEAVTRCDFEAICKRTE